MNILFYLQLEMEQSMSSSYDFESMDIVDRLDFLRPDANIFFFLQIGNSVSERGV